MHLGLGMPFTIGHRSNSGRLSSGVGEGQQDECSFLTVIWGGAGMRWGFGIIADSISFNFESVGVAPDGGGGGGGGAMGERES